MKRKLKIIHKNVTPRKLVYGNALQSLVINRRSNISFDKENFQKIIMLRSILIQRDGYHAGKDQPTNIKSPNEILVLVRQ